MKRNKIIEARWKRFIVAMVDVYTVAGMIAAYKQAYPTCKKDSTARVQSYHLLQKPYIFNAIDKLKREKEESIKKAEYEAIQQAAIQKIATREQLEAVLSDIALGKHRRKQTIATIDPKSKKMVTGEIDVAPSDTAMVAAADKLFKVKGAYAPKLIKHDGTDKFLDAIQSFADVGNDQIPQHVKPEG